MYPIAKLIAPDGNEVHFNANWTPDVEFSFVALGDWGKAAKRVLEERERHYLAYHPIAGTMPMSYGEVCGVVGEVIGKDVFVKQKGFEEAIEVFSVLCLGVKGRLMERVWMGSRGCFFTTIDMDSWGIQMCWSC